MANINKSINQKLTTSTDSDVKATIIEQWWKDAKLQNHGILEKIKNGEKRYRNEKRKSNVPWKGSANLSVPITSTVVDSSRNYIMESLLGNKPNIVITPKGDTPKKSGYIMEAILQSQFDNSMMYRNEWEKFTYKTLLHGVTGMYVDWYESTSFRPRRKIIENQETGLFEPFMIPTAHTVQFPRISQIDVADFAISPEGDCNNPERGKRVSDYTIIRRNLKPSDLSNPYIYNHQENIKKLNNPDHITTPNDSVIANDEFKGINRLSAPVNNANLGYEALECWHTEEKFDTELRKRVRRLFVYVVILNQGNAILVREQECPFYHYSVPLVIQSNGVSDGIFAQSMPMKVQEIQREVDMIHCQRRDSNTLSLLKMYKYKLGTKFDKNQVFEPNALIGVMNMDDIQPLVSYSTGEIQALNEEQMLNMYLQKMTGVNDVVQGIQSAINPNATATGTMALRNASLLHIRAKLRFFQGTGIKEILGKMISLNQQFYSLENKIEQKYVPEELEHDLDQGLLQVMLSDLEGEYDYNMEILPDELELNAKKQRVLEEMQVYEQISFMKQDLESQRNLAVAYNREGTLDVTIPPLKELEERQMESIRLITESEQRKQQEKTQIATQSKLATDGAKGQTRLKEKIIETSGAVEVAEIKAGSKGNR